MCTPTDLRIREALHLNLLKCVDKLLPYMINSSSTEFNTKLSSISVLIRKVPVMASVSSQRKLFWLALLFSLCWCFEP